MSTTRAAGLPMVSSSCYQTKRVTAPVEQVLEAKAGRTVKMVRVRKLRRISKPPR